MSGATRRDAQQLQEKRRERLRQLGAKAQRDPSSLSVKDLDDICTLAAKLCPPTAPIREPAAPERPSLPKAFEPLNPEPHLRADMQALLRLAHAAEYIASRVSEFALTQREAAIDARWKAEAGPQPARDKRPAR